ncbi:MAG: proliferating cell nuclear antigen (pcna) [Thermoplasmata archaeon]|nr:proliferating cell nuclear antigen (pcna) [Thermoplasmata archaeon]
MFQSTIKTETLKEIVDITATLVAETKFNISKEGIELRTVDLAHVAMIDLNISSAAFISFKSKGVELGVNLDKLKDVLRLAKSGDEIQMKHDEEKNKLVVRVANITRRMALVDTAGMSDPKVPSLDLPAKVTLKTSDLARGIQAAVGVSDHVAFIARTDGFDIVAEGDTDTVSLNLEKEKLEDLICKEKVRSMFPIEYLARIVKEVKSEHVTLTLGSDFPVKLEFDIAHGNGHVVYLLAPRIENA